MKLRTRVTLLVLVALLPALAVILVSAAEQRRQAISEAREEARRLARLVIDTQERVTRSAEQLLRLLAELPDLRGEEPEVCRALLMDLLGVSPAFANLGVTDASGALWCSAEPAPEGLDLGDRSFVRRALERRAFAVGDPQLGRITGRPTLTYALPILGERTSVWRIVFASADLGELGELGVGARLPEGSALTVFDSTGLVLARHPEAEAFVGRSLAEPALVQTVNLRREGVVTQVDGDGTRRLHAFAPLLSGSNQAFVAVGLVEAIALEPAERSLQRNLLLMALVLVLALATAWIGSDLLVRRRLDALTRAAAHWSAGELSHRAELPGDDEFARVLPPLNDMARRLEALLRSEQEAREALESRVEGLVEDRIRESDLLHELAELLLSCGTVAEAHQVIGRYGARFFPGLSGSLRSVDETRRLIATTAVWGRPEDPAPLAPTDCWALRLGRRHLTGVGLEAVPCPHVGESELVDSLCVPLAAQGETLGLMHLRGGGPSAPPLDEDRLRLALTFAEQCALALANLELRESLRAQSLRDPLTGLHNRRHLEQRLAIELARARGSSLPLSALMIDIDHFKRFNDEHGHEAGDLVLREVGAILPRQLRPDAVACRAGGEEFVVILPGVTGEEACNVAERVRSAVAALRLRRGERDLGSVTISVGVAALADSDGDGAALLDRADGALYAAKQAGRDRVSLAALPSSPAERKAR